MIDNKINDLYIEDHQIEKWNLKLDTEKKIQRQLDILKSIINKRKKESQFLNLVPCNGYIISKLLQHQGINIQYDRNNYKKCYYNIKESNPDAVRVALKDNNDTLHCYTIYTDMKEVAI